MSDGGSGHTKVADRIAQLGVAEHEPKRSRAATFSLLRVWFWLALTPVAYVFGWLNSVTFVSFISIWALVETSWAAYRADRPTKRPEDPA